MLLLAKLRWRRLANSLGTKPPILEKAVGWKNTLFNLFLITKSWGKKKSSKFQNMYKLKLMHWTSKFTIILYSERFLVVVAWSLANVL